jgi:hypothetical protein
MVAGFDLSCLAHPCKSICITRVNQYASPSSDVRQTKQEAACGKEGNVAIGSGTWTYNSRPHLIHQPSPATHNNSNPPQQPHRSSFGLQFGLQLGLSEEAREHFLFLGQLGQWKAKWYR